MLTGIDHREDVLCIALAERLIPRTFKEAAADAMYFFESHSVTDVNFFWGDANNGAELEMHGVDVVDSSTDEDLNL